MPHPFLNGDKIYLRGTEKSDFTDDLVRWANDAEVTHFMFLGLMPATAKEMEAEYERLMKSRQDVVFAIVDRKSGRHIGNVGLYLINYVSRFGEFRIIIGEKDFWGQGYGTEATRLTVSFGFTRLNLNSIFLGVNAEHVGAIKSYENAGFVHDGTMRQMIYRNGRYYDAIRMSILRDEYYARSAPR